MHKSVFYFSHWLAAWKPSLKHPVPRGWRSWDASLFLMRWLFLNFILIVGISSNVPNFSSSSSLSLGSSLVWKANVFSLGVVSVFISDFFDLELSGSSTLFARKRSGFIKFLLRISGDLNGSSPRGHERDELSCRFPGGAGRNFFKLGFFLPFLTRWGFSWVENVPCKTSSFSSVKSGCSGIRSREFALSSASSIDLVLNLESTTFRSILSDCCLIFRTLLKAKYPIVTDDIESEMRGPSAAERSLARCTRSLDAEGTRLDSLLDALSGAHQLCDLGRKNDDLSNWAWPFELSTKSNLSSVIFGSVCLLRVPACKFVDWVSALLSNLAWLADVLAFLSTLILRARFPSFCMVLTFATGWLFASLSSSSLSTYSGSNTRWIDLSSFHNLIFSW